VASEFFNRHACYFSQLGRIEIESRKQEKDRQPRGPFSLQSGRLVPLASFVVKTVPNQESQWTQSSDHKNRQINHFWKT
jgi:hypothetical protein